MRRDRLKIRGTLLVIQINERVIDESETSPWQRRDHRLASRDEADDAHGGGA